MQKLAHEGHCKTRFVVFEYCAALGDWVPAILFGERVAAEKYVADWSKRVLKMRELSAGQASEMLFNLDSRMMQFLASWMNDFVKEQMA